MEMCGGINSEHQLYVSRLSRKQKPKAVEASFGVKGVGRDLKVECMGEYILSNIHSNRKDIMNLYTNEVLRHKKSKSSSFPDIIR